MSNNYKSNIHNFKGILAEKTQGNHSKYHKFCAHCGFRINKGEMAKL